MKTVIAKKGCANIIIVGNRYPILGMDKDSIYSYCVQLENSYSHSFNKRDFEYYFGRDVKLNDNIKIL